MDLGRLYSNRFPAEGLRQKDAIWRVLCGRFFQKYVARDAVVLDLGAGYCEFLRNIECGERIAVDLNEDVHRFVPPGTRVVLAPSHALGNTVAEASVDVVFVSNFFEHLPDKQTFIATLQEIHRVLRPGGKLLVLQPNIRAVGGRYWDFIDHQIALTDRSLAEGVAAVGFDVTEVIPKFLPYTTRSRVPQSPALVGLYLKVPLVWRFMGGQTWLVAFKR
jgi:SAM-dependent methyltransferase